MSRYLTFVITTLVITILVTLLMFGHSRSLELEGGAGWFFPYGDWSNGFSRGSAAHVQVHFPFTSSLTAGAGLMVASLEGDGNPGTLDFLLPGATMRYEFDRLAGPIVPHLGFAAGISREVLEVGSGRETDFDVFVRAGGGVSWAMNDRASLLVEASHVWFVAPGGGRGFTVIPSFRFDL